MEQELLARPPVLRGDLREEDGPAVTVVEDDAVLAGDDRLDERDEALPPVGEPDDEAVLGGPDLEPGDLAERRAVGGDDRQAEELVLGEGVVVVLGRALLGGVVDDEPGAAQALGTRPVADLLERDEPDPPVDLPMHSMSSPKASLVAASMLPESVIVVASQVIDSWWVSVPVVEVQIPPART